VRSTPTLIALAVLCACVEQACAPASGLAQAPAPAKPPPAAPALPAEVTGGSGAAASPPPAAPAPNDDSRARAKALFERGVAAYDAGRHSEALVNFQEAFRLRPHPLVRVNIANCYDKLGKPIEALFHFDQFLASDVATPAQRQEVVAATERLRKQLGAVLLRVTPDGATAIVDGGEQRRTPLLDPLQLPAGDHTLEVRAGGYQTARRTFTVTGGASLELEIVLEPASVAPVVAVTPSTPDGTAAAAESGAEATPAPPEAAAPATAPSAPAQDDDATLPTHVWILGGAGVAMLAGATITGILALGAESDYERYSTLKRDAQAPLAQRAAYDDAIDAADRADTLAAVTDVLLVGAFASATAAVVFAVLDDGEAEPVATLTPTGPGVTLRATF
jgi:hypothetical protein